MLNGMLALGGGRELIVEIQLHIRCLYELKSDLHVLYAGARVLGAMEVSTLHILITRPFSYVTLILLFHPSACF